MKRKIYYLCYYAEESEIDNRYCFLSAVNKVDYIINAINSVGYDLKVISPCSGINSYRKRRNVKVNQNRIIHYVASFGKRSILAKILDKIIIPVQVLFQLMLIPKNANLIFYHNTALMGVVGIAKKLKKFKMILEVEEIYSDVSSDKKLGKKENKFFEKADSYIFPTQLLDKKINFHKKPIEIIHGTYQIEERIDSQMFREINGWDSRKIHVVYAGTLDPRKGGAIAATTAEFLSEKYHLHIIGFGSNDQIKKLIGIIEETRKKTKCNISFDGIKKGSDYISYLQACDIGLSTQNPDAKFNDTSFPSKILSYLANGLRVVSVKIPAIELSSVGNVISYYYNQTPFEIAQAIKNVDLEKTYDSRLLIENLSKEFCDNLKNILL